MTDTTKTNLHALLGPATLIAGMAYGAAWIWFADRKTSTVISMIVTVGVILIAWFLLQEKPFRLGRRAERVLDMFISAVLVGFIVWAVSAGMLDWVAAFWGSVAIILVVISYVVHNRSRR